MIHVVLMVCCVIEVLLGCKLAVGEDSNWFTFFLGAVLITIGIIFGRVALLGI